MNRLGFLLSLVLCAIGCNVSAQDGVGIGNWRTHMPYHNVIDVELFGDKVYAATQYELFTYDKEDNSLQVLNKINGLSDIGIATIRRNPELDLLVVAYTNSNIDLIDREGDIFNLSEIKDKNILVDKTIHNVVFKEHLAYFACGFGIVVYDLSRKEVKDTYYIGDNGSALNVTDIAFYNGKIFASTSDGLYYADENSDNLADYSSWSFDNTMIHPHLYYNEMEAFGGKLLVNYTNGVYNEDTTFVFDGNGWDYFDKSFTTNKNEMRVSDGLLLISGYNKVFVFDESLQQINVIYNCNGSLNPHAAVKDSDGSFWLGDKNRGLINTAKCDHQFSPNGPNSNSVFQLSSCGKHVWMATGGHATNWAKLYLQQGVCHFDGNWWTNLNKNNVPAFVEHRISDFVCCVTDPWDTSMTYVGTWGSGVLKFKSNEYIGRYDDSNSSLERWTQDPNYIMICGLGFDSKGNLWVANSGANNGLSVMVIDRKNGEEEWHSFNLGGTNSGIDLASIDKNDNKWIIRRAGSDDKIFVFNENGTFDNVEDDQLVTLRCIGGQGGLSGTAVNCAAVDRDGTVWVGTDSGPCYFSDPRKLFDPNPYDASVVLVPRNDGTDQADPLFNEIKVLSIAVDGNNNKWFGLESGVYEMSPDCRTEMHSFNTENSPLLDNSVNTMAINDDGEVFFGTNLGVISYKGFATPGGKTNSDVVVYPNPVRPGFGGYVGIKGLVEDALVRITTVDGLFVTELVAEGGQAVWDCTTVGGQKVRPGIYLVFVSLKDGSEKLATKILIMN